jgi:polar amino acid transport system substrate-binding protein
MRAPTFLLNLFRRESTVLSLACLSVIVFAWAVSSAAGAQTTAPETLPLFRHIDETGKSPVNLPKSSIRLLTDENFPPFSYGAPEGKHSGLSVELAIAACSALKLDCVVVARPFGELLPALIANEGDVIVSGLKIDENVLKKTAMTRPYFWSLGRFAVKHGSQLRSSDLRSLAGKRIGFVAKTSHGAWLEKYYSRSTLAAFPTEAEMLAALSTGTVDAVFGDDLRLIYWLAGSASNGCCLTLGGAYVDRNFFSRNLAFLARREDQNLVQAFDYALDLLQEKGTTSEIYARYLPNGLW